MDKNAIFSKLNKLLPNAVLEKRRFGRSEDLSIWVETKGIMQVAQALRDQPELRYDWLENLSALQMEGAIVLTYLVRSTTEEKTLIIRGSVVPAKPDAEVEAPSVSQVWPMAEVMEKEISEFFGVRFIREGGDKGSIVHGGCLPAGWRGFPLRKNYAFPHEVGGISRSRGGNA